MEVVCRCCCIPNGERQHSGGDCRVLGIRKVDLCFELVLPTHSEEEAFCEHSGDGKGTARAQCQGRCCPLDCLWPFEEGPCFLVLSWGWGFLVPVIRIVLVLSERFFLCPG